MTAPKREKPPLSFYLRYILPRKLRWYWQYFVLSLTNLYNRLRLYEIVFFIQYFFHHYSPKQFEPGLVKENTRLLLQFFSHEGLDATRKGRLKRLQTNQQKRAFFWKNLLVFGARQKRVEKVVYFTFLTQTLELYNPFDRKILLEFLKRKIAFLERLLEKVPQINGKKWNKEAVNFHILIFRRNSLLQYKVIQDMQQAVKQQKVLPILQDAQKAMDKGLFPLLITRGCSGSYWIRSSKKEVVGIFKPFDEEIHAPNNPGGPSLQGAMGQRKTRRGIRIGEAAHREVAAFVVDEFFGFGMVPKTYYASFKHSSFYLSHEDRFSSRRIVKTKYGSFQEFLSGFSSLDKVEKEELDALPLEEFQLLVILDLILGNTDRNSGNILVGKDKLAAVDHGLCFPEFVDRYSLWYWSFFEQRNQPIYSTFMELLRNFPYEELGVKLKKKCFISDRAIHRMRERIFLFIEGVDAGLTTENLEGLLIPDHLFPLKELGPTLKEAAQNEVKLFIDAGMPPKER